MVVPAATTGILTTTPSGYNTTMKLFRYITLFVLSTLLLTNCERESTDNRLTLVAESYGGGAKLAVDGLGTFWANGDQVRINDENVTVVVADGTASVESEDIFNAPYLGVCPASIFHAASGSTYTLHLPSTYSYATVVDGTHRQNLPTPMVAYATGGTKLYFRHLTAAVAVRVVNYYGFTIEVDSIVVSSNKYQLSGEVTVDMTQVSESMTVDATEVEATDTTRRVKMTFGGGTSLCLLAGDSSVVQLPVLPVGSDNCFTIKVCVHKVDQPAVAATFEQSQGSSQSDYSLPRARLAAARTSFGGLFKVRGYPLRKVIVSQGNLMYHAVQDKWQFAANQYTIVGVDNAYVAEDYNGWIDLFGWGTSGYDDKYPYLATSSDGDYGNGSSDIAGTDYDWGVHNAIYNGGNVANRWRTMTSNEWSYIFSTRTASTVNGTADARFVKATVNSVAGVILFPDEYTHPAGVTLPVNINSKTSAWTTNIYSEVQWVKMEVAGAVFLPTAGYRYRRTYGDYGIAYLSGFAYYWTSSYYNTTQAYYFNASASAIDPNSKGNRNNGYAVRLVRDL